MAEFSFSDDDREAWAEEAAAAMVGLSVALRKKMLANIGLDLPSNPDAVFDPQWWEDGLAGPVSDRFAAIASNAAGTFHEGAGWGPIPEALAVSVGAAVAAGMIANMGGRGGIVQQRVTELVVQGQATNQTISAGDSSATERNGEWLSSQLALETGDGGPLSDKLMNDFGASAVTNLMSASAQGVMDEYNITVPRVWRCAFRNSRESHMDANGQEAAAGEPFDIGGYEAMFPGDESLPVEEAANCQCWLEYNDLPDEVPLSDGGDGVPSEDMADEQAFALQGLTGRTRSWALAHYEQVAGLAVTLADVIPTVDVAPPEPAADAVPVEEDYSDSVCITVEPTAAEKQLLAVDGGLAPSDLHVTLAYLGKMADLDDGARLTIGTVLSQVAEVTSPFGGEVAGIGWFGSEQALTLALIDGEGLAALRTAVVDLLIGAGVTIAENHDFIPHCTLSYSQVDAADKVGMPLHFNEIRLRWGTEVLAFDLMGPIETAPVQPELIPEVSPTPDAPSPTEAPMTITDNATFADPVVPADAPMPDDGGMPPADLSTVPSDILVAEMARRAADQVVAEVAAQTGAEATADQLAAAAAATEEEAAEIMDDLTDAAEAALGLVDLDDIPDADDEPDPDAVEVPFTIRSGGINAVLTAAGVLTNVRMNPNTAVFGTVLPPTWTLAADTPIVADAETETIAPDTGRPFAVEGNPPAPTGIEMEWEGILCVEGVATDDGRMMGEGSIQWRQLPLPLTFLDKITAQHQLGEKAGTIHTVERRGAAIWGAGTFDDNEAGNKLRAYLNDPKGMGRYGVSADIGGASVVYSAADGSILDPMEAQDAHYAGEQVIELMTEGYLLGSCYDDETEILTEERGWQKFEALTPDDRVATRSPKTGEFEWQLPFHFHHDEWDGKMIRFTGGVKNNIDLLVTPNHRMMVKSKKTGRIEFMRADDLAESTKNSHTNWSIPVTSDWSVPDVESFRIDGRPAEPDGFCACGCGEMVLPRSETWAPCVIDGCPNTTMAHGMCVTHNTRVRRHGDPQVDIPIISRNTRPNQHMADAPVTLPGHGAPPKLDPYVMQGDHFAAFMGMWLSEGYKHPNKAACIAQRSTSKGREKFAAALHEMFDNVIESDRGFQIHNVVLYNYLKQFGTALEKFVPNELKNFSERQLKIFLDFYILGDGDAEGRKIYTSSKRMADDLQEIAQKCGMWAKIRVRPEPTTPRQIDGRTITANGPAYVVGLLNRPDGGLPQKAIYNWTTEEVDYKGDVRCVSVPNEALYVRRNGVPVWCGNTCVVHPALQEANIWLVNSSEDAAADPADAVLASGPCTQWRSFWGAELRPFGADPALVASGADVPAPPKHLFGLRNDVTPEPFRVEPPLKDGTIPVYGLLAEKGTCHTGFARQCVPVPESNDFRSFYTGKGVMSAEGEFIPTGPIIMDTVHPNKLWNASDTQAFYADTGCAVADVRLYRTKWGIVAAGVLSPFATSAQVYRLRASDVSPDWRSLLKENGRKEHKVVAVLAVPCSGFIVEGSEALVASGGGTVRSVQSMVSELAAMADRQAHTERQLDAVMGYALSIGKHLNKEKVEEALAVLTADAPLVQSRRHAVKMAARSYGSEPPCACESACSCRD